MLRVREMVPADYEGVRAVYQAGMDTNNATFEVRSPQWSEFDAAHIARCRLVAMLDDVVVGWAALSSVSSRSVYRGVAEVSIYVDVDHANEGVGAQLLSRLVDDSENAGFWTLQSSIMSENLASIRLHEKCGFRTVGLREAIGKDRNGRWRDTVLMERRSDQPQFV